MCSVALKRLERAVASASRLSDAALIQDGCIMIWNAALPLLQVPLSQNMKNIHLDLGLC